MSINKTEKQELIQKLNQLLQKQLQFQREINELQRQIVTLKTDDAPSEVKTLKEPIHISTSELSKPQEKVTTKNHITGNFSKRVESEIGSLKNDISFELEKFIGENLISKIGIAVLIIGVGIGVKYAIDNNLISPLMRIILGYAVGFVLNFLAFRLKSKYLNFSAVLVSGAMAIHYFITYAAFTYYNLIPQPLTFILMVLITAITVAFALQYNQQVIAHFGLVGAYIVPFLLKDPNSSIVVLLTYISIVNCGIFFISTRKRWKTLNYLAFVSTWLIFMVWFFSKEYNSQLGLSLTYSTIYFVLFYLVFLSYKLLLKEKLRLDDIFFLILNSGVFFFVGIIALNMSDLSNKYAGLFTLSNAIIHALTAYFIFRFEKENKNLFHWTIGLVIAFITIAISVQFNNFITAILWSLEAAILFWYGRNKNIKTYEYLSYFIIFISSLITAINWTSTSYNLYSNSLDEYFNPIFNRGFLASLIVCLSFGLIYFVSQKSNNKKENVRVLENIFNVVFPIVFLLLLYFTFFNEISLYWNNVQINAAFELNSDGIWEKQFDNLNIDIMKFRGIWLLNYTLLFASLLSFVNFRWLKNTDFNAFILFINTFLILIFLGYGLNWFAGLRSSYLNPELLPDYDVSINHLIIRYISLAFFAVLFYSTYRFVIPGFTINLFQKIFEVVLTVSFIGLCSTELINWLSILGSTEIYKHWLSILWGVFSLLLVSYGIWKKKTHLRFLAIILFSGTLIKLFFYDLTNLETVPKTIVFISIGGLLLVVSFMYNKYTKMIFEENQI